jgi:hypothetical protein
VLLIYATHAQSCMQLAGALCTYLSTETGSLQNQILPKAPSPHLSAFQLPTLVFRFEVLQPHPTRSFLTPLHLPISSSVRYTHWRSIVAEYWQPGNSRKLLLSPRPTSVRTNMPFAPTLDKCHLTLPHLITCFQLVGHNGVRLHLQHSLCIS